MLIQFQPGWAAGERRRLNWLGSLLTAGVLCAVVAENQAGAALNTPVVLTQVPVRANQTSTNARELPGANGFEGARVVLLLPDGKLREVSKGFSAAADPEVSFDGQRIVFAGKREHRSPWAIWETSVAGGDCRQVTKTSHDCRSPRYLSSLFTLDSPEPWFTVLYAGREDQLNFATSLYSVKLDGTERRRISFNPNGDLDPVQLPDGRVVYSGYVENAGVLPMGAKSSLPGTRLFSINIDGTGLEFYGGEQGRRFQWMPCATEGGLVVFVESDTPAGDGAGQLGAVEQRRPHHLYRRVTDDSRFAYLYPSPLHGNTVLVSRRPANSSGNSAVFVLDIDAGQTERLFDNPKYDNVQAKAVRPRPVPDGRSTVVNLQYDTGTLYALNLYEADARLGPHLTPGSIQRARVIEGVPAEAPRGPPNSPPAAAFSRRLLGEAPVEKDGSLHVLVPADVPLEIQALDADGLALATCHWIWVKQKENRGCIGCHEDHELVPENLYALAVQRPANKLTLLPEQRRSVGFREHILPLLQTRCAAADCHGQRQAPLLGVAQNEAGGNAARKVYETLLAPGSPAPQELNQGGRASSRAPFPADVWARGDARPPVQPVLRQPPPTEPTGCAHGKYVDPGCARTSFLIWELAGRDKSRPWDQIDGPLHVKREIKKMPPSGQAAPLTEEEFRLFVEWIDMGAAWEMPPHPVGAVAKKADKTRPAGPVEKGGM
jgi:hypothetical protein